MASTNSTSSFVGFVSSMRRLHRPPKRFRRAEVDGQRLAVADVQIAVRLRRKTGVDLLALEAPTLRDVFFDEGVDKIFAAGFALSGGSLDFLSHMIHSFLRVCCEADKIMKYYIPYWELLQA